MKTDEFNPAKYDEFDNNELWSLDFTIACFLVPRLKRFKERAKSFPSDLTVQEWSDILDTMIEGFEEAAKGTWDCDNEKVQKGLDAFSKYYFHLWD